MVSMGTTAGREDRENDRRENSGHARRFGVFMRMGVNILKIGGG